MLEDRSYIRVVVDISDSQDFELSSEPADVIVTEYDAENFECVLEICSKLSMGCVVLGGEPELAKRLSHKTIRGWALLPSDSTSEELAAAVQGVSAGLVVFGGSLLHPMLAFSAEDPAALNETLTARETEVLRAMAGGLANKQIAARLAISVHTAKFHVAAILAKLDAASRTEAVAAGVRRGLVHL
jgi:DNA-binding NarL/FixJ family response regulator